MDFILVMLICSGLPGNECKPLPTPIVEFKNYHNCIYYAYDYSGQLLKDMSPNFVDQYKAFTTFDCKETSKIKT
jgi:hypothetical protein|tara:strand:+ start:209 stop:430 length:222 start_codon:yes stop_codon:yes gene_type:complete